MNGNTIFNYNSIFHNHFKADQISVLLESEISEWRLMNTDFKRAESNISFLIMLLFSVALLFVISEKLSHVKIPDLLLCILHTKIQN